MTPEQQDLLDLLFEQAAALPSEQRAAFLNANCADPEVIAEAQSLLEYTHQTGPGVMRGSGVMRLIGDMSSRALNLAPVAGMEAPGTWIGPYLLGEVLGEGGMGVVYRADQRQPLKRSVALKIVKPGMDSRQVIARFETERQSLALMDHPNIARVYDAGATPSGRPYFVMELVDGIPITRYCDQNRLSPQERLKLFIPVCEAIQHAHQKGVIHRDIKPSNVLVAEQDGKPVAKVIDFGIAKAMAQTPGEATATMLTNVGTVVGTLDYMSPEQADVGSSDIDTRSDVYSLGVLLYELLTGATPLSLSDVVQATYLEMLRRIREVEPAAPSARLKSSPFTLTAVSASRRTDPERLPKLIHGELDWIVMKALEKERGRRYQTANGLIRDIQRYLAGEPVEAGPPSSVYRLKKLARKHRLALATVAAFLMILIVAVAFSTREALRARRAEQVAEAVNGFLRNDLLAQASSVKQADGRNKPGPDIPDPDIKVRTVLDRAAKRIGGQFKDQPSVEAAVRSTISETYTALGLHAEALPHAERALALQTMIFGPDRRSTLASANQLGRVLYGLARYGEAEALQTKILNVAQSKLGKEDPDTLEIGMELAETYDAQAKLKEAEQIDRRLVASMTKLYGAEEERTLNVMDQLANNLTRQAKYAEAIELQKKVLEVESRVLGPDHPQTINILGNLAVATYFQGDFPEAERLYGLTLDAIRRVQGPEHPRTLAAMTNLSVLQAANGQFQQALKIQQEIFEIYRRTQGPDHLLTGIALHNLSSTLLMLGMNAEAEKALQESLKIRTAAYGPNHTETLKTKDYFGTLRRNQKRFSEAEAIHRAVMEGQKLAAGPNHPNTLFTMTLLANVLADQGRYAEAEAVDRAALGGLRKVLSPAHMRLLAVTSHLGFVLEQQGKYTEAESLLRPNLAAYDKTLPTNWQRFHCQSLLGRSLAGQNQPAAAEPLLRSGYQGMLENKVHIPAYSQSFLVLSGEWLGKSPR